jgi:aryl carrier-like protein
MIAYVIGEPNLNLKDLNKFTKRWLPEYMVPDTMVQLQEFPKLPNGKVDLQALPLAKEKVSPDLTITLPSEGREKLLVEIWENVLSFQPIGIHDNFFEIGGDSIISIQIVAKAREAGITLTPNQLFENQTVAELAAVLKDPGLLPEEEDKRPDAQEEIESFSNAGLSEDDMNRLYDQLDTN